MLERAWVGVLDAVVALQTDRAYFRREILPALARMRPHRVLFVGVRGYTRGYGEAFRGLATEYWTADIDPAAAAHGEAGRHIICDVRDIGQHCPAGHFDLVLLNGVFGWGCDTDADMNAAAHALAAVLQESGYLLIGWNTDRSPDPATLEAISQSFVPASPPGLPAEQRFADVTHVFSWFRRKPL